MNKKKGMTVKVGLANPERIVGYMQTENFNGVSMHVDPKYLKEMLFALTAFDKKREDVEIGISNDNNGSSAFFIFLDGNREMAIGVVGRDTK